jgi:hypothetical protein
MEHRYTGMTVNERLFAACLLDAFETAALARDRARMIALLEQVELSSSEVRSTTDSILAAPARYGF